MNEINDAVGEKIFGWTIDKEKGTYIEPGTESGLGKPCPDFLVYPAAPKNFERRCLTEDFL